MSLVVLYDGKKKTISLSPSATLQQFADAAVAAFDIKNSSAEYVLTHKNAIVDKSLPFRLSGLANNSLVELCNTKNLKRSVARSANSTADARIAVTVGGLGKASGTFKSDTSLLGVLSSLQSQELLPAFPLASVADVAYLGQIFTSDDLENTTLQMLGLGGQSGRLQVRLKDSGVIDIPNTDHKSDTYDVKLAVEDTTQAMEVTDEKDIAPPSSASEVVSSFASVIPSPREAIQSIANAFTSSSVAVAPEPISPPISNPTAAAFGLALVQRAISAVLSGNFDAVSSAALVTIAKYVNNLLTHYATLHIPDCKFTRINIKNRLFSASVGLAKGGTDVLLAMGFRYDGMDGLLLQSEVFAEDSEGYEYLRSVRLALEDALEELQVKSEDRPPVPPIINRVQTTAMSGEPAVEFDPYKSYHFSTTGNKPPQSGGESTIDLALKAAMRRKQEIYGEVHSIHIPVSDAEIPDGKKSLHEVDAGDDESESDPAARKLVATALMKRISNNSEEGPPLTTRALRDLEKAKREVVYGETLVQIKFPDRVVLLGHFHPLNTMEDVYSWLGEHLSSRIIIPDGGVADAVDLYITPPRQSLRPSHKTLEELKLVPAASLYASLRLSPPDTSIVDTAWYLNTAAGNAVIVPRGSVAPIKSYPTGIALFPSESGESKAMISDNNGSMTAESKSDSMEGKRSKPKWMKL